MLIIIPNISKWKFKYKININYIFKGCNSLLIFPNISKWNVNISEEPNISSFNSNSISNKTIKSDTIMSDDIIIDSNSFKDLYSLKDHNDNKSFEKIITIEFPYNNESNELNEYYDTFYD